MSSPPYNVLFLCTGNSARSVLAECALRRFGGQRFHAFSAGSHPKPAPHPRTLALLRTLDHDVSTLRSKSWDEFAAPGAPEIHFVFTVCDAARGETCPVWPGRPVSAHWGLADPAQASGSDDEIEEAFRCAYRVIEARVRAFIRLPLESLEPGSLQAALDGIGDLAD